MNNEIEDLIDKYRDVIECSDDWVEKNLSEEFIEDLKGLLLYG